jgi:HAD superfamily hydrolase (TIGR01549 family)
MMIKGVIFDFDGTLADTFPLIFLAFRAALTKYTGRVYSDEELTRYFGPSEDGILQRIVPGQWQAAMEIYLAEYKRHHAQYVRLFPGIHGLLEQLKDKPLRMGIITGKSEASLMLSLDALKIKGYFDILAAGSPERANKDTNLYQAVKRWGLKPDEVIYVGDAASDIVFAREAGVVPVGVSWCQTANVAELQAENPAGLFGDVREFLNWIIPQIDSNSGS